MKKLISSAILGFILVWSASSMAMEKRPTTLSGYCKQFGAFRPKKHQAVSPLMLDHWAKNKAKIKQLANGGPFGTVVVLGPGPGNDLPIKWLVKNFAKVILIDGYTTPMEKLITKLADRNASIRQEVEIIELDLTGGYYELLKSKEEDIVQALVRGFNRSPTGSDNLAAYAALLKENLTQVDLAQYKPDMVISSLVTSQLGLITQPAQVRLIGMAATDAFLAAPSAELILTDNKRIANFSALMMLATEQPIQELYFSAISQSGAQKIYYADTQTREMADQRAVIKFGNDLAQDYVPRSHAIDGWSFNDKLKVSHYTFVQKPRCASCNNNQGKLLRCSKCKKATYCNTTCQSTHWHVHKLSCNSVNQPVHGHQ